MGFGEWLFGGQTAIQPTSTPVPTLSPQEVNSINQAGNAKQAQVQSEIDQKTSEANKWLQDFNTQHPVGQYDSFLNQMQSDLGDTQGKGYQYYLDQQYNSATTPTNDFKRQATNYVPTTKSYTAPQANASYDPNYYVNGTVQTRGGGITPDGSYSAGYHGSGGRIGGWIDNVDRGQWGTGANMGPMVNGTIQTGGGGFTPDGSYSAGYHGSGANPEITGESQPGNYKSGSFGPVNLPEMSNPQKAEQWLRYLETIGYDVSSQLADKKNSTEAIASEFNRTGTLDTRKFIESLSNPNPGKTDLIFSTTAQTPLKDIQSKLGANFSYLTASPEQYTAYLDQQFGAPRIGGSASTLNDVAPAVQTDQYSNPIQPYASNYVEPKKKTLLTYKRR